MNRTISLTSKMFLSTLSLSLLMMLTTFLGTLVDNIVIGQFLGGNAVAAAGLLSPVILALNLPVLVLANGTKLLCSQRFGKADREGTNQAFTLGILLVFLFALLQSLLLGLLAPPFARFLGATGQNASLAPLIIQYMRGYAPCYIPMGFMIALTGVMQLDNASQLAYIATLVNFSLNVTGDLLNITLFHGGMLGMALATTFASTGGAFVLFLHFRKKHRFLAFTKHLTPKDGLEICSLGGGSVLNNLNNILKDYGYNILLVSVAGIGGLTAMRVASNFLSFLLSMTLSLASASAVIAGIAKGEHNQTMLEELRKTAMVLTLGTILGFTLLIQLGANILVRFFIAGDPEMIARSATWLRFLSFYLASRILVCPVFGILRGTGGVLLSNLLSLSVGSILPLLCAFPLGFFFGEKGILWSFPLSFLFGFLLLYGIARKEWGRPLKGLYELVPPVADFPKDEVVVYEGTLSTLEEASRASEEIQSRCLSQGSGQKLAMLLSLAVEEFSGNTVRHSFEKGKPGTIDVRLIKAVDVFTLSLRDDGVLFDPLNWWKENRSQDSTSSIGIRLVLSMAQDVTYVPMMKMNKLIVRVSKRKERGS